MKPLDERDFRFQMYLTQSTLDLILALFIFSIFCPVSIFKWMLVGVASVRAIFAFKGLIEQIRNP